MINKCHQYKKREGSDFFVKKEYHRKGIGRKLFEAMLNDCDEKRITVNASPYA